MSNTYVGYAKNTSYSDGHTNNIRHQYQICQQCPALSGTCREYQTLMWDMSAMSDIEWNMSSMSDTDVGHAKNIRIWCRACHQCQPHIVRHTTMSGIKVAYPTLMSTMLDSNVRHFKDSRHQCVWYTNNDISVPLSRSVPHQCPTLQTCPTSVSPSPDLSHSESPFQICPTSMSPSPEMFHINVPLSDLSPKKVKCPLWFVVQEIPNWCY